MKEYANFITYVDWRPLNLYVFSRIYANIFENENAISLCNFQMCFFSSQNCAAANYSVKKFIMANSERSLSPPLYQVHETKDGRLVSFFHVSSMLPLQLSLQVNRTLQVEWPHHPPGNKKLFDGYIMKSELPAPISAPDAAAVNEAAYGIRNYIGAATLSEVKDKLRNHDFLIFYRLPEIQKDGDLPQSIGLTMGYSTANGKVYYLPIQCEHQRWTVQLPDGQLQLNFRTIQNLVEFFLTYGFNTSK